MCHEILPASSYYITVDSLTFKTNSTLQVSTKSVPHFPVIHIRNGQGNGPKFCAVVGHRTCLMKIPPPISRSLHMVIRFKLPNHLCSELILCSRDCVVLDHSMPPHSGSTCQKCRSVQYAVGLTNIYHRVSQLHQDQVLFQLIKPRVYDEEVPVAIAGFRFARLQVELSLGISHCARVYRCKDIASRE